MGLAKWWTSDVVTDLDPQGPHARRRRGRRRRRRGDLRRRRTTRSCCGSSTSCPGHHGHGIGSRLMERRRRPRARGRAPAHHAVLPRGQPAGGALLRATRLRRDPPRVAGVGPARERVDGPRAATPGEPPHERPPGRRRPRGSAQPRGDEADARDRGGDPRPRARERHRPVARPHPCRHGARRRPAAHLPVDPPHRHQRQDVDEPDDRLDPARERAVDRALHLAAPARHP